MNEKVIGQKKNGMVALLLIILEMLVAVAVTVVGGIKMDATGNPVIFIIGLLWVLVGWIPFLGLKVLKPQEALVLTLFGKYIGTLRDDGFYFVNPADVDPVKITDLTWKGFGHEESRGQLKDWDRLDLSPEWSAAKAYQDNLATIIAPPPISTVSVL